MKLLAEEWQYQFEAWLLRMGSFPVRLVYSQDKSGCYETDAKHLFRLENGTYSVVHEVGCSCYDYSDATVEVYATLDEAVQAFRVDFDHSPSFRVSLSSIIEEKKLVEQEGKT